jgi:hypothetical protein
MRQRLESAQPYCYCATQDRGVPPPFPASNGTAGFGQAFPVQSNFELSTIITPNSGDLITKDALFDAIANNHQPASAKSERQILGMRRDAACQKNER